MLFKKKLINKHRILLLMTSKKTLKIKHKKIHINKIHKRIFKKTPKITLKKRHKKETLKMTLKKTLKKIYKRILMQKIIS